jgi:hypothetical protein
MAGTTTQAHARARASGIMLDLTTDHAYSGFQASRLLNRNRWRSATMTEVEMGLTRAAPAAACAWLAGRDR